MFNKNKKDPLVDAVKSVMNHNDIERQVVQMINEKYHVTSRNGLPYDRRAAYDADVKAALAEGLGKFEEISTSDPKDATSTIKSVNSGTRAEREAGGRNDNGSGDGDKDSGDPKRANKDIKSINSATAAERDAGARKEQIKEDEKQQRYANVVEALNKQFRFKRPVSEDDSSFKSPDGTGKNANLEEAKKKSDEPRSDYSAGSDDDESDSARWRAEQRLKMRGREGREDLDEEQLDELSRKTIRRYQDVADRDAKNSRGVMRSAENGTDDPPVSDREYDYHEKRAGKRSKGFYLAQRALRKNSEKKSKGMLGDIGLKESKDKGKPKHDDDWEGGVDAERIEAGKGNKYGKSKKKPFSTELIAKAFPRKKKPFSTELIAKAFPRKKKLDEEAKTADSYSPENPHFKGDRYELKRYAKHSAIVKTHQDGKSAQNKWGGYSTHAVGNHKYVDKKWKQLKSHYDQKDSTGKYRVSKGPGYKPMNEEQLDEISFDKARAAMRKAFKEKEYPTKGKQKNRDKLISLAGSKTWSIPKKAKVMATDESVQIDEAGMKRGKDLETFRKKPADYNPSQSEMGAQFDPKLKARYKSADHMKKAIARGLKRYNERLNEVSMKKAFDAYRDADDDYGNPKTASRLLDRIEKKWGSKAVDNAAAHSYTSKTGRHTPQASDKLSGSWNTSSKNMRKTKSGKINKQDLNTKKSEIKSRLGTYKKRNLPEEMMNEEPNYTKGRKGGRYGKLSRERKKDWGKYNGIMAGMDDDDEYAAEKKARNTDRKWHGEWQKHVALRLKKKAMKEGAVVLPSIAGAKYTRPNTVSNASKKQDKGTVTGGSTTINKNSNAPVRPGPSTTA